MKKRLLLSGGVQTAVAVIALRSAFVFLLGETHGKLALWLGGTLASAIAAPYTAHAMTVVYYRLTNSRPAAEEMETTAHNRWASVWDRP